MPIAAPAPPPASAPAASAAPAEASADQAAQVHAGPSVRRLARELDVDLAQVAGSGPKGRILKEDVKAALVGAGAPAPASGGFALPPIPTIDHGAFGEVPDTMHGIYAPVFELQRPVVDPDEYRHFRMHAYPERNFARIALFSADQNSAH